MAKMEVPVSMFGSPFQRPSEEVPTEPTPLHAALPVTEPPAGPWLAQPDFKSQFRSEKGTDDDPLLAFKSEQPVVPAAAARRLPRHVLVIAVSLIAISVLAAATAWGWNVWKTAKTVEATPASTGTAMFSSTPNGAVIMIDGIARGTTPVRLSLPVGAHTVEIRSGSASRTLPLTIDAHAVVSQYIELAVNENSPGGRLEVGSEPPGAQVRIDGVLRGVAPLVVPDLRVGKHELAVSSGDTVVTRTVNVTSGATATLVVSTRGAPIASAGWLTINGPFDVEVFEGGRLLGTSRSDRLMMPIGSHEVELANVELEFRDRRTVQIVGDKTASLSISRPNGSLSVNAVPWADVLVDGRAIGTTPLANVAVPIGSHEVLWRHPQLGERRQTVAVKAQSPTRIGMDFSK